MGLTSEQERRLDSDTSRTRCTHCISPARRVRLTDEADRATLVLSTQYTRCGALHPLRGATPDAGRYTRSEEVHCLRIGCSAPTHKNKRGADRTSPLPTTTSPSIGHQADLLSPIDAAPPRASSWACAQVVDGLFMRLLSRPLGVARIRWGICRRGWCGCGGGCRSLRSRWRPRCRPGRGW